MVIGRELRLIIDACRAAIDGLPLNPGEDSRDWALVLRLARFHRVQGLVWQALAANAFTIPQDVASQLSDDARSIAHANLQAVVETERLLAAFQREDLPCLTVKGLALAARAYRTISTKSSVDIDLLVREGELGRAAQLLSSLGYELAQPAVDLEQLKRWHRLRKESTWTNATHNSQVDLHTRLADNPALIPAIGIGSPRSDIEVVPGVLLASLADEELFAYLCVHGASSLWFRLKWITDLAALIRDTDAAEMHRLYRRSQELGAGRAADLGLLLADYLYGTLDRSPDLRARLSGEHVNRWLLRQAVRQLSGAPMEPTSRRLGTLRIHLVQPALLPGWGPKLGELVRQVRAVLG